MAETPGMSLEKKTLDNKLWIHESSRPFGTVTYFTSEGDATTSPDSTVLNTSVGGGKSLEINHVGGVNSAEQDIIVDFNTMENTTYIHEGYIIWSNADFDKVSMSIIPTITDSTAMSNTYFNLYNNYLFVPAAGDGSVNPVVDGTVGRVNLVESPLSRDTGHRKSAYWNCDYDSTTHTFGDITAAPNGDGTYNIFAAEVTFAKFVNKVNLVDNGFIRLQSADVEQLGHGLRVKLSSYTNDSTEHSWKAGFALTLNREHTS